MLSFYSVLYLWSLKHIFLSFILCFIFLKFKYIFLSLKAKEFVSIDKSLFLVKFATKSMH